MSQSLAIVLGVLAAGIVVSIPIILLTVFERRRKRAFAALATWAHARGLSASTISALPPSPVAHVAALSVAFDGGVLSIATAESRQQAYITFYYRPQRAPKTTFSLQRPMWGTSGVPLGDAELDAHYLMTAGAPEEVRALLNPPARAHLLQYAAETWSLSLHAGTWTYVQVGTLFDAQARDRVLDLLRLLAAPHDAHGLRHRHG